MNRGQSRRFLLAGEAGVDKETPGDWLVRHWKATLHPWAESAQDCRPQACSRRKGIACASDIQAQKGAGMNAPPPQSNSLTYSARLPSTRGTSQL